MFGNVIHSVSRADLLQAGDLVDVTTTAKEAGIKFPTAVTSAVWEGIVTPDEIAKNRGESEEGRLWDVLSMFNFKARKSQGPQMMFPLIVTEKGEEKEIKLKAIIGPGDTMAPVITILMPDED